MGIHRSHLRRQRREDAAETAVVNGLRKDAERGRRDARMLGTLRGGSLPYAPSVMSWLSRKLDKRSSRITPEDVKSLLG